MPLQPVMESDLSQNTWTVLVKKQTRSACMQWQWNFSGKLTLDSVEPLSEYLAKVLPATSTPMFSLCFLCWTTNVRGKNHVIELHQWWTNGSALVFGSVGKTSIAAIPGRPESRAPHRAGGYQQQCHVRHDEDRPGFMRSNPFAHHVLGFHCFGTCREMTSHLFRRSVIVWTWVALPKDSLFSIS